MTQTIASASGAVGRIASRWEMFTDIWPWVMLTPFGYPVVPPVYCRVARSSGAGRGVGRVCVPGDTKSVPVPCRHMPVFSSPETRSATDASWIVATGAESDRM